MTISKMLFGILKRKMFIIIKTLHKTTFNNPPKADLKQKHQFISTTQMPLQNYNGKSPWQSPYSNAQIQPINFQTQKTSIRPEYFSWNKLASSKKFQYRFFQVTRAKNASSTDSSTKTREITFFN